MHAFLLQGKVLSCIYTLSPFNSEKKKKPQRFKAKNDYKNRNKTNTPPPPKTNLNNFLKTPQHIKDQFYNQHNELSGLNVNFQQIHSIIQE